MQTNCFKGYLVYMVAVSPRRETLRGKNQLVHSLTGDPYFREMHTKPKLDFGFETGGDTQW